ncbi:MAG: TIGR04388 family protein, partial [Leptospirales bacterium]
MLLQKQAAYAAWEIEADRLIEQKRTAFVASLGRRVEDRAASESDQSIQSVDANQIEESALNREQLQWQQEFQSQVDFGWLQFQTALNDVQQRYDTFNQSLTAAEQQFQQNQAAIHAYEQNVRTAIQSSVTGARSYVASNGLYHVETCAGSNCTVDMGTLNAAGIQLDALLDSVQQGLNNATPLSVLAQQMQTFLEAEELQATTRKNYWNSIKDGSETLAQQIGLHALVPGQVASPPITLSPYSVAQMEAVTTASADAFGLSVAAKNSSIDLVWARYLRAGDTAALDSYIQSNGENRTIVSATADVCGDSSFRGGHFFGEFLSNMAQCYSTAGHRAFAYRSEATASNKFAIALETDLMIRVDYDWEDANAAFNETVWQGYENDLSPVLFNWRDQILPAIQNWETQVAQYDLGYANWQTLAAQQRADADATFAQSQAAIVNERSSFLSKMQAEYRKGRAQWDALSREQSSASAETAAKLAASIPVSDAVPIALDSFLNINYTLGKARDAFRLDQKFLTAADSNLPDAQNLSTALSAFQTAIQGSVNLATAETLNEKALTERQRVIDAMKAQLETNSLADMSDDEIYAMVEENAHKEGRTLESSKEEIVQGMRADAAGRVWVVEQRADGKLVAKRKMKVGIGVLRAGGDGTNAADYLTPDEDQILEIAPPKSMRLASTGGLFEEWDDTRILDEFDGNTREYTTDSQAKLQGASNLMREADAFQQHREVIAQEHIKNQVQHAQAMQAVITGVAQGASATAAWNQHWIGQVRGQVAAAIEKATGFPAGLISPLLGGADIKTALGQYAEGVFWQNFQEFHNLPPHLTGAIQNWFNTTRSKAEFRKKRREAARLAPEDMILGPLGALTYSWRNSQYHKAGQVAMQAVETVGGILLNTVGNIIPGAGTAIYAGYMAMKQAYLGSLNGGTIGAVAGLASGVANAFTSMVGVNVNAGYTFEDGFAGSVGVGVDLGGGMNIGASVQMQEGEGVTGFGVNAGYGPENGFGGGIGLNFDRTGSFQGGNLNFGYNQTEGLTNNVTQHTNYSGALNFSREGFTGVTASASRRTSTQANTGYRASHTLGAGLTMNFDGSYALNINQSASAGDAARFGFNSYGAGTSDTYTFGRGQEFGVDQTITSTTGYSTRAQAEAFIEDQKEELRRRMAAEDISAEERVALQADIDRLDQKQNIVNPERAKRQWAERGLQEMVDRQALKPEEAAAFLAAMDQNPDFIENDGFRNLLAESSENADFGGSRDTLWEQVAGGVGDTIGGLFGFSSGSEGFVDGDGEWRERTCFVAGTLVRVPDGTGENGGNYKRIENLEIGDTVLSWDEGTRTVSEKIVIETFVHDVSYLFEVTYENGSLIETTWNHPFYVEGLGWVDAENLKIGDRSLLVSGKTALILSNQRVQRNARV